MKNVERVNSVSPCGIMFSYWQNQETLLDDLGVEEFYSEEDFIC